MGASIGIAALLLLLFIWGIPLLIYAARVRRVGPHQVAIVSGRDHIDRETGEYASFRIVRGGRVFVWPILERIDVLSLALLPINFNIENIYTKQRNTISIEGVANVKIASDNTSLQNAAERFLGKDTQEIKTVAYETIISHISAVVGTLTIEDIQANRDMFTQNLQDAFTTDLANMGLGFDSFVIKDIRY